MFKLRVSQYINNGLVENNWTYKNLSDRSGVPTSTIHSYAQGKTSNPNEENLIRIAAAFGDPPSVIHAMRKESVDTTAKENLLIAKADDKELMEKYAALIRESVTQILEEYRAASAAQQTEIIAHADARIEDERQRCKLLNETVLAQCQEEIARVKSHNADLLALKDDQIAAAASSSKSALAYLKTVVRNLSLALIVVSILAVLGLSIFGGYAVYAYNTFDREDPTRGLYRVDATSDSQFIAIE